MSALDSSLFHETRVTDAQVGGRADAIVTSTQAHGHASRPRHIRGADNVTALTRALIQTGALPVQTRELAERLSRRGDTFTGV